MRRSPRLAAAALAGLAILASPQRSVAVTVVVATVAALIAAARRRAGRRWRWRGALPRRGPVEWRLALSNLHRPGAPTPAVVLSLGLGLAVIVALTLVDVNLRGAVEAGHGGDAGLLFRRRPKQPARRVHVVSRQAGARRAGVEAPMMRGRIVRVAGVAAENAAPQGKRAMGAGGRPRHHLRDDAAQGLRGRRRRLVAGRLRGAAAGLGRRRDRQGARPEARRHADRQRARARRDGEGRQFPQGRLALVRDQFRAGVLARHVPRRAAFGADDGGTGAGRRRRTRRSSWCATRRATSPTW